VNARRNVPKVEGAEIRWPSTAAVCPDLSTSQSWMQSAPSAIAESIVIALRPGFAAPAWSPRSTRASTSCSIPNRWASSSSNTMTVESFTMRVTS
jgi:hypothetical protein